jgi:hypothetical protein
VFESVQGVYAFAVTSCTFFIPALAAGLWLFSCKKLCPQITHVIAVLNVLEIGCAQFKLLSCVVYYFIIGQAAGSHSTNGTGF